MEVRKRKLKWPPYVLAAIKSGPIPERSNWRDLPPSRWTRGQRICGFIEHYLRLPDGSHVGKPFKLIPADEAFILAVYDNPAGTRKAFNTRARKNNKTTLIAALVLAHVAGPEAIQNSNIYAGAMTKDQAGIVHTIASKMVSQSEELQKIVRSIPSGKRLVGLTRNVEFKAMARDGPAAMGLNGRIVILDEIGSLVTSTHDDFIDAMTSCTGAWDDAIIFAISTQAAGDNMLFSQWLDDAERANDQTIVSHVYTAKKECDLMDEEQWQYSNPGLGISRSKEDLKAQLLEATRIPAKEANARVLLLNQRYSMESLWLAPAIWKENNGEPDFSVFREKGVSIGLDLSQKHDLTVATICAMDDTEQIHCYPFAFTPKTGLDSRERLHRNPYRAWVNSGDLIAVDSAVVDYDWVCEYLRIKLSEMQIVVKHVHFDRWRINEFLNSARRKGFALDAEWSEVGQGYQSMTVRVEAMETALLQRRIRHGSHPIFNLGAAAAIKVQDPSGNSKLDKAKSSNKIDGIVSMVMAIYPYVAIEEKPEFNVIDAFG